MLGYIQRKSLSVCNSIETADFFTLYKTIFQSNRKDRIKELVESFLTGHKSKKDKQTIQWPKEKLQILIYKTLYS